mgnify:CR=1 FL=1|jgi:hypothetical protein
MGEKKEYVKLWLSYRSYFEAYSAAEVGRLVLAAMDYRESGAEPEFSGSERFIWPAIRRDIDESVAAQKAISASRSEAGKQGGRPESEKANASTESNEKQKKQMLSGESKKSYGQRKRTKEKDMDSILSPLPPTLRESVEKWVAYKGERREEYKPVGLQSLVTQITKAAEEYGEEAMADVISRSMAANYKGIVFDWLKEASTRPASLGRAAKPGYGVQGHHDPLNPLEEAAVNRLFEKPPKGAEKMRHGVQNHGDDLTAFQMAAVERMLAENEEDKT